MRRPGGAFSDRGPSSRCEWDADYGDLRNATEYDGSLRLAISEPH
jgi:hypothetical protein